MRIVVLDGATLNPGDNPWTEVRKLGELIVHDRTPEDQILARARDAVVLVTNKVPLTAQTLASLPALRFVAVTATGYNVVDTAAARARGVAVSTVPVYSTDSVAQLVFALLLEMCHYVGHHDRLVHDGRWARSIDYCFWDTPLLELAGRKMGLVGFGRIGRRTGELAHAFGMEVLACGRPGTKPPLLSEGEGRGEGLIPASAPPFPALPNYRPFAWKTIEELFAESDVVSLHCPQTPDNLGMVDHRLLGLMKPTAMLINTARGALVNEADLAAALNEGKIAGAAVDVVSREPIDPRNPLLAAKNCLLTPHIAWATLAARRRLMGATADNIRAFQQGRPINVVN